MIAKPRSHDPPPAAPVSVELLDRLLAETGDATAAAQVEALFRTLKRAFVERALDAPSRLCARGGAAGRPSEPAQRHDAEDGAHRRWRAGAAVPRDRAGTFAPVLVPKHACRLPGFDAKVLSLYMRGVSTRDIRAHLEELYAAESNPDPVSAVPDPVVDP